MSLLDSTENELEKIVGEMSLSDLQVKEICYICAATGVSLNHCLHRPSTMKGGPITSDRKCYACYETEEQTGRMTLSEDETNRASFIITHYEKFKKKRLENQ